jgi:hypothetical protein
MVAVACRIFSGASVASTSSVMAIGLDGVEDGKKDESANATRMVATIPLA